MLAIKQCFNHSAEQHGALMPYVAGAQDAPAPLCPYGQASWRAQPPGSLSDNAGEKLQS